MESQESQLSEESFPKEFASPYEWIGGQTQVKALVDHFYALMDSDAAYSVLRAVHGADLSNARHRLYMFLCGWLGGPDLYVATHGHPRLKARHMPFSIGILERDQWLACMSQAMHDIGVDETLRMHLSKSFFSTADWMRNRSTD